MTTGCDVTDDWDDGAFYSVDPADRPPRRWHQGDRVRRVAGPEILLGSVGTVIEVDIPGMWPIRVHVDNRIGFGKVLCSADELEPE
ncbi:hypothetical protein [Myceligenerans indicum]|uniref:Uncharacterized protein n=1 Tax=Myceligenerans indicum TaxID=2593663 RepID=A0ABS1LJ50_9MICO|nr:hypothetical protein [Myceligenerans indicum]MBL0886193.1 hypothetical protein [Myceligenerans indicum]